MKRAYFTLVELIVVMLLAVIVFGIAAGAYMNVGDGLRVDGTTQQVGAALLQARQLAQASRRKVAVIFPGPAIESETSIENRKKFACFRLVYVTGDLTTGFTADGYPDDTEWMFAQSGTAIMEVDVDPGIARAGSTVYQAVENPTDNGFQYVDNCDLTGIGTASSLSDVDRVRAVVYSPSGRILATGPTYVTIGQAHFNAGIWRIEEKAQVKDSTNTVVVNVSTINQITLELNRFSGGTRYLRIEQYPADKFE